MNLPRLKYGKWNYAALAFVLPVIGIVIFMMINGCTPFGIYSMLYSDMYHQYFPFFKAFREALLSGDSLLYNWNVGMGMDYLGLISYYLASPLNLLSVLIPESWLLPYFSFLTPIKLGLASMFFAIFLKKLFGKNDLSITLFGCFYGTCAWALGYQWNIMWLDAFALLPLVALGTVSLLRDKKFILYTVTLFLSVFSNYYIGFFVCIFVLLLFICYQICRWQNVKRFFLDLCRIALFSILAIGMTAILELPALAALQTTQSSVNSFPEGLSLNIVNYNSYLDARQAWNVYKLAKESGEATLLPWLNAVWESIPPILSGMRQVAGNMNGGLAPSFKEGLPNLYCGVGTIFMAFLFLTSRQVKLRDKLCSLGLLLFFILSILIRQLDYIWHGFHFTNMIPYRFSFLFSFVMLYMAYRAFLLRRRFEVWQILCAAILSVNIILFSKSVETPVYLAYNGLFFLLYLGVFLYARWDRRFPKDTEKEEIRSYCTKRRRRRMTSGIILACVLMLEFVLNIVNFGVNFPCTYVKNYPLGTEYTASMIRYMKEREEDNLFYRAETTHTQTLNDGALNSYYGISTFTSSANVKVTEFTRVMGLSSKNTYNRYCYEEGSPVANLFFALKYLIERQGQIKDNAYFDNIHHYGNVYLLENNAYLPLGFLANSALEELEFAYYDNAFIFQNQLFTAATGIAQPVWITEPGNILNITSDTVTLTQKTAYGFCDYAAGPSGGTITYHYQINTGGFLCMDTNMPQQNSFTVKKNGVFLFNESITLPQTLSICQVVPGDEITIEITCKANEDTAMDLYTAILDDAVFREGYEILNASTLDLSHFSNTRIEGTISCNRDGLLYTSIPQDGNWTVTVDGQKVEAVTVGDAMVAVPLTQGDHTLVFRYENRAFSYGLIISLVCFLIFAGISLYVYYPKLRRRKGKYEQ